MKGYQDINLLKQLFISYSIRSQLTKLCIKKKNLKNREISQEHSSAMSRGKAFLHPMMLGLLEGSITDRTQICQCQNF